jgi:hypothetical protein
MLVVIDNFKLYTPNCPRFALDSTFGWFKVHSGYGVRRRASMIGEIFGHNRLRS